MAMTWALEIIGTASNAKVSRVFPGSRRASARCRSMRRRSRSASSCSAMRGEEAGGGPAFLVGLFGELRPHDLDGGQAQLVEEQAKPGGIDQRCSSSCRVSRQAVADQGFVGIERSEAHDNVGQPGGIGREAIPQGGHVGQLLCLQTDGELIGQFALAATLVGHGEKLDHDAAGLPFRQALKQSSRRFAGRPRAERAGRDRRG